MIDATEFGSPGGEEMTCMAQGPWFCRDGIWERVVMIAIRQDQAIKEIGTYVFLRPCEAPDPGRLVSGERHGIDAFADAMRRFADLVSAQAEQESYKDHAEAILL